MGTLTITLRQPTQVSTRIRSDQLNATETHIPGWVVRGALANAWIRRHGTPDGASCAEFVRLFEGGVRFGPLFASDKIPPPLSRHDHKYVAEPNCNPASFDAAITPMTSDDPCDTCGQPWKQWSPKPAPEVPRSVRMSVAIDPVRDVAAKGQLFSRDRLAPETRFCGPITSDDVDLLQQLAGLDHVRIGARRTTHGAVDLTVDPTAVADLPPVREDGVLLLRLLSPAVFVDDEGRPTLTPNETELHQVLGVGARVERSWARWGTVGGWHMASGLPKPTETVAVEGSTYAVRLAEPVSEDVLRALVCRGLGLRRHEGFGHLFGNADGVAPPVEESADDVDIAEVAAALTDSDLVTFLALKCAGGMIPEDMGRAIRDALSDPTKIEAAIEATKAADQSPLQARTVQKVRELLTRPKSTALAILMRLEGKS